VTNKGVKKMARLVPIADLPVRIKLLEAIEMAHRDDLDWIEEKIGKGLNTLVECEKQLVNPLYEILRTRLKRRSSELKLVLIGGPSESDEGPQSIIANTVIQLQEAIFSGESDLCLVVPHLDVAVTTTQSGLSDRAREVIAMIYENRDVTILAFKDPSFEMPKAITSVFAAQRQISGIPRDHLYSLITQQEARKFAVEEFNPFELYKFVSGLNVIRFREIMGHVTDRLDFDPSHDEQREALFREIREMTVLGDMQIPEVDLHKDIGGYKPVKDKIDTEILELLAYKSSLTEARDIKEIEEIVPKGMLFVGPPGTGKTFFAKAMACSLNATVSIVSGPELKSKWVGESEGNLRDVFAKARKAAPSIIIFDEIDSFATARGTYSGSGVEHSMVNQLLTEMDGFRKDELVFVVGTTNFPESLDPALLRPGRFELQIEIPYPDDKDREEILEIYRKKFNLSLTDELLEFLVQKTGGFSDMKSGARFSGDHLYAICRALKREAIRHAWKNQGKNRPLEEKDCLKAIQRKMTGKQADLSEKEIHAIAIHESGHAVLAHYCPHTGAIERVSVATDDEDILGFVLRGVGENKYVRTKGELLDDICVCMGGRVAESMFLEDVSIGCSNDLQKATEIARVMVEELGMSDTIGLQVFGATVGHSHNRGDRRQMSASVREKLDEEISSILAKEHKRAQEIIEAHKKNVEDLTAALLEKKTLYKEDIDKLFGV